MRDGRWRYTIIAYRPPNQGGGVLNETVHETEASRDIELSVYRDRMRRGEVSHVEVIAHVPPYGKEVIWQ